MNKLSKRLHVWLGEDVLRNIEVEAEEMNTTKSEMLRIILNRHYRNKTKKRKRYNDKYSIYKYTCADLKISLPIALYNDINKYCNKNGYTRSHFIRKACIEFLMREGCK